jgi:hypothetical protein
MQTAARTTTTTLFKFRFWKPTPGSGAILTYRLLRVNGKALTAQILLAASSPALFYAPPFFLRMLLTHLEADPDREDNSWGWIWVFSLFTANVVACLGELCAVL